MKEESKYPIGGYAPGYYACRCVTCKTQFIGHKRAAQCESCAIKMVEEQTQSIIENVRKEEEQKELRRKLLNAIEELEKEEKIEQETLEEVLEKRLLLNEKTGFIAGVKWKQEQICNSEVLQKIKATKSDAEARRIIRTL